MNENSFLITVAVNYYNDKRFLSKCIESILNQSYKNFELILFNHASTDGSRDIARSYNDPRIIHIDAPKNLGAGASYNLRYCLPSFKGKFYKGFCADDVMLPDCLKHLAEYAQNNPEKGLIFGNLEYINAKGKKLGGDWFHSVKNFSINTDEINLLKIFAQGSNILPCSGAFVKTEKLRQIKMDNSLTIRADIWLWLSLLIQGNKIGFCNKIVGSYRRNDQQESYFDADIIARRSETEKPALLSLFFEMRDINVVKAVFPDSPYADKLTDAQDIPFYVAEYFFRKNGYPFAYDALFKMMLDDKTMNRLENIFGFGVLELRRLYAFGKPDSWKKRLYSKNPKKLNEAELFYLLVRRCLKTVASLITLRSLRHKF